METTLKGRTRIRRREFLRLAAGGASLVPLTGAWTTTLLMAPTAARAATTVRGYGPNRPMIINWTRASDPPTIDPAVGATVSGGLEVIWNVYDTLVGYKGETLEIEPRLAESWQVSPDGTRYTFKLRKGVKYHSGATFNAHEVKYNLERIRAANELPASYWGPCASIDVIDDYTVRMNMKYPFGPWLSVLAGSRGMYMGPPRRSVEARATKDDPWASNYFRDHEDGTGPYMLEEWKRDVRIMHKRFPEYWGRWAGKHADKHVYLIVKEAATNRLMVEKGQIDIGAGPPIYGLEMGKNPNIAIRKTPSFMTYWLTLNTQKPPLDNKLVRQAICYAFDYDACLNDIYMGFGEMGGRGPIPRTLWPFVRDLPPYKYDLNKAKRLLAEAGYPNGGFTLNCIMMDVEERRRMVELLQAGLKKLNINLTARYVTWPVNAAEMGKPPTEKPFHVSGYLAWPSYPDPDDIFKNLESKEAKGGLNWAAYQNPEVDKLIQQGKSTLDKNKRVEIYTRVCRIVQEDAPIIVAVQNNMIQFSRKWVKTYIVNAGLQHIQMFYPVYVEGRPPEFDHL
ncbi:MAG: ABC transporter substrate-binding protein [Armatimonadetes bacterium]|nr:ABC transporter substrate-binding protein [Armatimonadota bacterium]